jgi:hypothetical protein
MRERGLAHGLLDQLGLAELLGPQPGQDPLDLVVEVAAASGPSQRRAQPRAAQRGGCGRSGRQAKCGAGVGAGQILKYGEQGG